MSTALIDLWTQQVIQQYVETRLSTLEDKYVRSTRFTSLPGPATSGAVALPPQSVVVLDDFGGTVDAVVSSLDGGRPSFNPVYTASGQVVAVTFDSLGNFVLSGTPASFPVAIIYRVVQHEADFDSLASNIIGAPVKDTQLQTNIDTEAAARANGDATLQGQIDALGGGGAMAYSMRVDFVGDTIIYKGEAVPGASSADPVWRISKITLGTDGDVTTQWASGSASFNQIWDNHLGLTYV
jgi:hypothetical protein